MSVARIRQQTGSSRRYVSIISLVTLPFQRRVSSHLFTAMSPAEVTEKLGLHRMRDRSWYVHPR